MTLVATIFLSLFRPHWLGHIGSPGGHFGFSRWCRVAGCAVVQAVLCCAVWCSVEDVAAFQADSE